MTFNEVLNPGYVFVNLSVFTLDTRPSSVGRINLHPKLGSILSIRVVPEVTEGFVAILNVSWLFFFLPVQHLKLLQKLQQHWLIKFLAQGSFLNKIDPWGSFLVKLFSHGDEFYLCGLNIFSTGNSQVQL